MQYYAKTSPRKWLLLLLSATFILAGCINDGSSSTLDGDGQNADTTVSTQNNRNAKAEERRNDSSKKDAEEDEGSTETEDFALLSWQAPTHRNNGESLYPADIKEYRISYGTTQEVQDLSVTVQSDGTLDMEHRIEDLAAGEWYFTIQAVDYDENISSKANLVSKTF